MRIHAVPHFPLNLAPFLVDSPIVLCSSLKLGQHRNALLSVTTPFKAWSNVIEDPGVICPLTTSTNVQ